MAQKFSDFSASSLSTNVILVGYDSVLNANVQIPKSALDALYAPKGYALAGNLNGSTVGLGVTTYFGFGVGTINGIEIQRRTAVPAGTVFGAYVRTVGVMTGSTVVTVMKNGVATAMTFTIAAGSAAALYGTSANTFTVADGDELSLRVAQSTAASIGFQNYNIFIK